MLVIRVSRLRHGVEVNIDYIVQHAHGGAYRPLELVRVQFALIFDVSGQIDRTEVAHGDFVVVCIQSDLGAEIGAVHHANMVLWGANIAGILESNPGVAGFEEHAEHLAP